MIYNDIIYYIIYIYQLILIKHLKYNYMFILYKNVYNNVYNTLYIYSISIVNWILFYISIIYNYRLTNESYYIELLFI